MSDEKQKRPEIAATGTIPEDIRALRKVHTLAGESNEDGSKFVEFPVWYTRTGVRTATIDSGLGKVVIKAGSFSDKELESDAGYTRMLELIVSHPAWDADEDITLRVKGSRDDIQVEAGKPIPDVETILAVKQHPLSKQYVEECYPPSLLQQVMTAQYFLRYPPIAFVDPQTED